MFHHLPRQPARLSIRQHPTRSFWQQVNYGNSSIYTAGYHHSRFTPQWSNWSDVYTVIVVYISGSVTDGEQLIVVIKRLQFKSEVEDSVTLEESQQFLRHVKNHNFDIVRALIQIIGF